jgi:hypothetical protein
MHGRRRDGMLTTVPRSLRGLSIPYTAYDLSMDEDAKRKWHRARKEGAGLPGYLVDDEWVGVSRSVGSAESARLIILSLWTISNTPWRRARSLSC